MEPIVSEDVWNISWKIQMEKSEGIISADALNCVFPVQLHSVGFVCPWSRGMKLFENRGGKDLMLSLTSLTSMGKIIS